MNNTDQQIQDLQFQIDQLTQQFEMHQHNGSDAQRIQLKDIFDIFQTVNAIPTAVPKTAYDQIKLYTNSTTYRLYWYDLLHYCERCAI